MKNKLICPAVLLVTFAVSMSSCEENEEVSLEYSPKSVTVLTVDYTTNKFLGGYSVPVGYKGAHFELGSNYNFPSDFGSVTIYDKKSHTTLFAGDIIWMGKGERTYPKNIFDASHFGISDTKTFLPEVLYFDYKTDGFASETFDDRDLAAVWEAVSKLEIVHHTIENGSVPRVYFSLYRRSVGVGDPADWYWLIFIKG